MKCLEFLELDQEMDLFDMLDVDEDGELTFHEFFHGCMLFMNANEPAKGKDFIATYLISQSTRRTMQEAFKHRDGYMSMPEQMGNLSDRQNRLERDVASLHTKVDALSGSLEAKMDNLAATLATLVETRQARRLPACLLPINLS